MKTVPTKILLVEDNPGDARLVQESLSEAGATSFDLTTVKTLAKGLAHLKKNPVDVILLDLTLPDSSGMDTFTKMHAQASKVPIVLLTGFDDDSQASQAVREGAQDYLVKGQVSSSLLVRSIRYAIERKRAEELLHENERRFRDIFEGVEDAIFVETPDGRILDVNQRACEMFGYSREQFLTKTVADLVPSKDNFVEFDPEDPPTLPDYPKETLNIRANGEKFPIELSIRLQKLNGEFVLFVVGRDVTERKRMEEALHASEDRLHTFLNSSSDLAFLKDDHFRHVYANQALLDFFGRPAESVIGKTDFELMPADAAGHCRQTDEAVLESGQPHLSQQVVESRHFETIKFPVALEGGQVGIGGFIRDITERKQAENALRDSEERFRAIYKGTSVGLALGDLEGRFLDINPALQNILGYSLEELHRLTIADITYPDDLGADAALFQELLSGKRQQYQIEKRYYHKDGHIVWGLAGVTIVRTAAGEPQFTIGMIEDITERKQAEEALRESEEKYHRLFENSLEGIGLSQGDRILDANKALLDIFGYKDKEEFLSKRLMDLVAPESRQLIHDLQAESTVKGLQDRHFEYRILRKDGEIRDIEVSIAPIKIGTAACSLSTFSDITERKQAKEALAKTEQIYRQAITQAGSVPYQREYDNDTYTFLGEGFAVLTGYAADEMTGELFTSRLRQIESYGEHLDLSHAERVQLAQQGKMKEWREDYLFERKDGSQVWLADHAVPIYNNAGAVSGTLGILTDITDRKQAETALRQSEERYRLLFEISPDAIAVYREGKIVFANPATQKLVGASSQEELTGKAIMDFVHPDYREMVIERLRQQIVEGKVVPNAEEKFVRLDGSVIDVDVTAAPIHFQGSVSSMVIIRDITERKLAEEKLARQTEELRQRNEELARLYRASGSLAAGSSLNLQELAKTIVTIVQHEFGQSNCSLVVVQKGSNELRRLAISGPYSDQVKDKKLNLDGSGMVAQAIRTGKVFNIPDVRQVPDYLQNWEEARSELTIPLMVGDNIFGAIDVQSSEAGAFSPDDERLMTIFSERAALALEHSRLYSQTEQQLQRIASLHTVDMAIASSFDLNTTLNILLDQLTKHLNVHATDVLIFDRSLQTFTYACRRGFRTQSARHLTLGFGDGYAWQVARERRTLTIQNLDTQTSEWQKVPELSGEEFVSYVGVPLIAKGQLEGVLEIYHHEPIGLDREDYALLEMLASQAAIAIDNIGLFDHLQNSNADLIQAYDTTLEGWATALELRDKETEGHTRRVADQTIQLARVMQVPDADLVQIYRGALLHDIGKMGVPDSIVLKPGPLTEDEWVVMHKHPEYAYHMLSPIAYLRPALDIPYCHHERWDGTGYPRGLKGVQIPLAARIFAIIDVWDALTSDRPYRKAWTEEKARRYIQEQAGSHFDPEIAQVFSGQAFKK